MSSTTYKSLIFHSASEPATLTTKPLPYTSPDSPPPAGSILVRPLYAWIPQYSNQLYTNGNPRGYGIPWPCTPGTNAVARVIAPLPADATLLKEGDLVLVEPTIRARDDPENTAILLGLHAGFGGGADGAGKLADESLWRHGVWGEVARVPLENVTGPVDEAAFLRAQNNNAGGSGNKVTIRDLGFYAQLAVPFGGLDDPAIALRPGETVVVSPATGNFGGAAVHCALAMGAGKVVAMGRDEKKLALLKEDLDRAYGPGKVETAVLTGTDEGDLANLRQALGTRANGSKPVMVDVFADLAAGDVNPAHVAAYTKAAISCMRIGGRVSLMGGQFVLPAGIPYPSHQQLTFKGTFMYSRQQGQKLLRMIETGVLKVGEQAGLRTIKVFGLEDWEEAIEAAAHEGSGVGRAMYFGMNGAE